jgi:hypothetical protein
MESWQVAWLVLAALLVGATIPALVQISLAARSARVAVDRASARLEPLLGSLQGSAARFEEAISHLDGKRIERLLEAVDSLSRIAVELRETTKLASALGAAVGPAVGAAVRAWRASSPDPGDGRSGPDERLEVEPGKEVAP